MTRFVVFVALLAEAFVWAGTEAGASLTGAYCGVDAGFSSQKADSNIDESVIILPQDLASFIFVTTILKDRGYRRLQPDGLLERYSKRNRGSKSKNGGKFVGGMSFGYNWLVDDFYINAECCFGVNCWKVNIQHGLTDSTPGYERLYKKTMDYRLKAALFSPHVLSRFGYYVSEIDAAVYLNVGAVYKGFSCTGTNETSGNFSFNVVAPFVGLGAEKMVYDRFSVRMDANYIFNFSYSKRGKISNHLTEGRDVDHYLKHKVKSYELRVSVNYKLCGLF